MSEQANRPPGLLASESRGCSHPLKRAGLVILGLSLCMAGCGHDASEMDARMILSEQERLHLLADPATLAAAQRPPADGGRWTGPTSRRAVPTSQPILSLTIEQAVLMALDRNHNLVVQRYAPRIAAESEQGLYGQFDPALTGQAAFARTWPGPGQLDFKDLSAQAAVQQFFPTGTTAGVTFSGDDGGQYLYGDRRNDLPTVRLGLTVTQQLLQGTSVRVNLAAIRQAQLDVLTSQYELRGFTETLAATVEQAYITYLQDERVLHIAESALTVAEDQLAQTDAMIGAGRSAASDRPAASATVAQRHEDVINARSALEQARLTFLQLVDAPTSDLAGGWDGAAEAGATGSADDGPGRGRRPRSGGSAVPVGPEPGAVAGRAWRAFGGAHAGRAAAAAVAVRHAGADVVLPFTRGGGRRAGDDGEHRHVHGR